MALRHAFPFKGLPELRVDEVPTKPPPVFKEPKLVEFRPESNIEEVAESMVKYSRVRVRAATGAGKSTRLPIVVARKTGKTVYLVVPLVHLACDHYHYLVGQYPGEVSLAIGENDRAGEKGVTVTTYAWLIGMLIVNKGSDAPLGNSVVFADEVHESDAYSYVTRKLGMTIPGLTSFVEVSATHDPARMPMREPKGEIKTQFFPRMAPGQWDPQEDGFPWSFNSLTGNTLIMLDDDREARRLVASYCTMGVSAYRMSSRMPVADAEAALREMRQEDGGLVVLVADYSFRNGGTYNVTTIIDSGLVRKSVVKGSDMVFEHRIMYELEKYQTSSRGGRTEGSSCVYWIPDKLEFPSAQCMLEGVEAEAAAVLLRVLGYSMPQELKNLVTLPTDKIPKDLSGALNRFIPLALLPLTDLVSVAMPKPTVDTSVVTEVLESYGIDASPVEETLNLFSGVDFAEQVAVPMATSASILDELQQLSTAARTLEAGYYYACPEAVRNGSMGQISWETLLKSLHDQPLLVTGYSVDMRKDAVAMLLLQYNSFLVVGAAVTRVGAHKAELSRAVRMYPEQVKVWTKWLAGKTRESEAMCASILKGLEMLRTPGMAFVRVPPNKEMEEAQAKKYVSPLLQAMEQAAKVVDESAFFGEIGEMLGHDPGPQFPAIEDRRHDEDASETGKVRWKTIKIADTVMHDMYFTPNNPLRWSTAEYVEAVARMLAQKGVHPRGVRKLVVDAPDVDCDKVMQAVRDGAIDRSKVVKYKVVRSQAR